MLEYGTLFSEELIHGFSNRLGGVSRGYFASLNVGRKWGDDPAAVDENMARIAWFAGFEPEQLKLARQVHGTSVIRARDLSKQSEADAIWTHCEDEQVVVGVLTADCVPILLADVNSQVVAAIHSGWRGTVANICGQTVRVLQAQGIRSEHLQAAIGPCIEGFAFEVDPEVAKQFPANVVDWSYFLKPHIDLVSAVRQQLEQAGLPPQHIERIGACTWSHPDRYFSYRRDGSHTGQHLSLIGFPKPYLSMVS